jgi:hypothetical protein
VIRRPPEIIFLATIDYGYQERNKGRTLRPNSDSPYEQLQQDALRIITTDLPSDLRRIYGMEVQTRVIEVQSGSILVFFGAVLGGFGVLSSYADFFESVRLLKAHCKLLLERVTRARHSGDFDVSVVDQRPSLHDPSDLVPYHRLRKMFGPELEHFLPAAFLAQTPRHRRDGFFWFLLVLNIVLLAAVGILVAAAVIRTYFP